MFIYLFGVLFRFQHCTGHIMTGSWKGRGNQYIEFVRDVYCKLPTNGKQLPAFPLEAVTGIEPQPQRWEARVLPLCHRGPPCLFMLSIVLTYSLPWNTELKSCDNEVVCLGQVCDSCFATFLMSKSFCNGCFATVPMSWSCKPVIVALPLCCWVNYYSYSIVCNSNVAKYFWLLLNCTVFVHLHCLMNWTVLWHVLYWYNLV